MKTLIALLALVPSLAFATKQTTPPVQEAPPTAVANGGYANSDANSHSNAAASSTSNSSAYSVSENSASATSGGNVTSFTSIDTRQAPSIAQGALYIGECGASGNAGGSRSSGSAFLGFAYTPKDCKLLLAAKAYQALGMVDSACEMLNQVSAVKAAWKALDKTPPSCAVKPEIAAPVMSEKVVSEPQKLPEDVATKAYVDQRLERAFKASQSK